MDTLESAAFREDLRRVVGRDFVWVNAQDTVRHYDPIYFAVLYAGHLFLIFVEKAVGKAGEKFADLLQGKLPFLAGKHSQSPSSQDQAQLDEITEAAEFFIALLRPMATEYSKTFLQAGQDAVRDRLIADNLPSDKADKIAREFRARIESQLNP